MFDKTCRGYLPAISPVPWKMRSDGGGKGKAANQFDRVFVSFSFLLTCLRLDNAICPLLYRSASFLKTTKILHVAVPRIEHGPRKQRHLELASTQVRKQHLLVLVNRFYSVARYDVSTWKYVTVVPFPANFWIFSFLINKSLSQRNGTKKRIIFRYFRANNNTIYRV